jgi:hypothetical protein
MVSLTRPNGAVGGLGSWDCPNLLCYDEKRRMKLVRTFYVETHLHLDGRHIRALS